ncbi:MAG: hypothetical protein JWR54_3070 [Mucilaginibacter sp.]|nr:hypothetical protein [Mucilaginibacter sp.]
MHRYGLIIIITQITNLIPYINQLKRRMKSYLILILALSLVLNAKSQTSKTARQNLSIILELSAPEIEGDIFTLNGIKAIRRQTFNYRSVYGEYVKEIEPVENSFFQYTNDGVLKSYPGNDRRKPSHFEIERIDGGDSGSGNSTSNPYYDRDTLNMDTTGRILDKPWLKYLYNRKNQISTLFVYDAKIGNLVNRYVFVYNQRNQIAKRLEYHGDNKEINHVTEYSYDINGNKIESLTYQPHNDESFPKGYSYKERWIYDRANRLIKYYSYKNDYGKWYPLSDMETVKNGKIVDKTLTENLKGQQRAWIDDIMFEYGYVNDFKIWSTRKSFIFKSFSASLDSVSDKKYLQVTEQFF